MPESHPHLRTRYRRGLATSTLNNSSAFGFSVMITSTFGLLNHFHSGPSPAEVAMFAFGAVAAIGGIEATISRGFRRRLHPHPSNVVLLGTAGNLISVGAALAAAYGVGLLLPPPVVWLLAPLLAAAVYVLSEAGELALAEQLEAQVFGEREAEAPEEHRPR